MSEQVLQNNKINTGTALKERETVCRPHIVGLHRHEVVHGELVLGDRALPMVLGNQNQTDSAQRAQAHGRAHDAKPRAGETVVTSM